MFKKKGKLLTKTHFMCRPCQRLEKQSSIILTIFAAVTLVALNLPGCAPREEDVTRMIVDLDVEGPPDSPLAIDVPDHDVGEDCNRNRVNDAYDWAGFIPRGPYDVGENPRSIAAGQLRGGRLFDLAVANHSSGTITILHQRATRRFETAATIPVDPDPSCVAIGDVDGDHDQDIVVGHDTSAANYLTILFNDGDGTRFTRGPDYPVSLDPTLARPPKSVITTDLDGGGIDILAISESVAAAPDKMVTLMSNGAFDAPQNRVVPRPSGLAAADFDGDGALDLALTGVIKRKGTQVVGLKNGLHDDPPREFSAWEDWRWDLTIGPSEAIYADDLNGDGEIDVAVVGTSGISVLHNSGLGWVRDVVPPHEPLLFESPIVYSVGGAHALAIADADADGDLDIALPITAEDRLSILANMGGTFTDPRGRLRITNLPVSGGPRAIVAGDLDRDGRIEFAIANQNSGDVWVLHRRASIASMPLDCEPPRDEPEGP
ncbi:MAG: VCBS repeat-containing protein [Phycisphaerales bacterium]|nr:MAG: VCBS repeat-containing protein [Phycisphaerales bacterium]